MVQCSALLPHEWDIFIMGFPHVVVIPHEFCDKAQPRSC
jgi:hypothetical protein